MNQTRVESVIEKIVDMVSGMGIAWIVYTYYVYPRVHDLTPLAVVSIFTVVSFFRGLAWRRFFNRGLHKAVHKLVTRWVRFRFL